MNKEQCTIFDICEAPLCPMFPDDLQAAIWYADEPVCTSVNQRRGLHWAKIQRRLAKFKLSYDIGYFTVAMLETANRVTRATKGINPNTKDSAETWIAQKQKTRQHPSPTTTMPVFGETMPITSYEEIPNPPKRGKDTPAKQLTFI